MEKIKKLKDISYWLMISSSGAMFLCRFYSWVILAKIFLILFIIFVIIFVALYCYVWGYEEKEYEINIENMAKELVKLKKMEEPNENDNCDLNQIKEKIKQKIGTIENDLQELKKEFDIEDE
jgi:predicted membrane protein